MKQVVWCGGNGSCSQELVLTHMARGRLRQRTNSTQSAHDIAFARMNSNRIHVRRSPIRGGARPATEQPRTTSFTPQRPVHLHKHISETATVHTTCI